MHFCVARSMSQMGQKRQGSERVQVFRFAPINGHPRRPAPTLGRSARSSRALSFLCPRLGATWSCPQRRRELALCTGATPLGLGALATLPAMSPRAVGEAAYYGGKLAGGVNALLQRLGQATLGNLPARANRPFAGFWRVSVSCGIRHVGGAKLNRALVRNVRTWPAMPREKAQAAPTARPKVSMRRRDCPVVVMKRCNARGAKGAGHRR
jgi:hypothetical protein